MLTYSTSRTAGRVGAYIEDSIFPCSRKDLLQCAEDNDAPDLILDAIENLPQTQFTCLGEVMSSLECAAC